MSTARAFRERSASITAFVRALSAGDVEAATRCFAEAAHIMTLRYAAGRLVGGETIAVGREAIGAWLSGMVERRTRLYVVSMSEEGESIVVQSRWSLDGFHGERLHETVVAKYEIGEEGIRRLSATAHE